MKAKKESAPKQQSSSQTSKYCCTHGACAHTSQECELKADKQCDEATFENMLGGSPATGCRHDNLGLQLY